MSDLNKLKTFDGLTENQFNAEPAMMIGLLITAEGTNNAGETGDLGDLGAFQITRNGNPLINRTCDKFGEMNDIRGGIYTLDSIAGDSFEAGVMIPFFEKGLPNALHVRGEKELNIRFIPASSASTVFSSINITVQALSAEVHERYNYKILSADQVFSAAVNADRTALNQRNVTTLYIDDVDDVLDSLSYESNDRVIVSNNSPLALRAYTNTNNRIEDDTFSTIEIENFTPGVQRSSYNRNNQFRFSTSGAGSVDVTVCSVDWFNEQ